MNPQEPHAAESHAARPAPGLRASGRLLRLTLKELREILRDRRTIVTLVLMPLLVYPLLSITFRRFLLTTLQPVDQVVYVIAVEQAGPPPDRRAGLDHVQWAVAQGQQLLGPDAEPLPDLHWHLAADVEALVDTGRVDMGVAFARRERPEGPPVLDGELIFRSGSPSSQLVLDAVEKRLRAINEHALRDRLRQLGASDEPPLHYVRRGIEGPRAPPFSLAAFIPLILVLMTITGAVYPAIDLTAGERERGTLEALIAAPVSRFLLLLAKFQAVLAVAVMTATVNLVAMTVTIYFSGLGPLLLGAGGLTLRVVLQVFGLMILLAGFFSAVLLALTSFARSFKEAQAYLIPLMLVALAPGLLSLMPGVALTPLLAVTPLLNVVLLSRDLLEFGVADPLLIALALVSTLLYGTLALGVAARVFGTDAVLYGSRGSWSDLVRRPPRPSPVPTFGGAGACLAVIFLTSYVATHWIQLAPVSLEAKLQAAALATIVIFGLLPLLFAIGRRLQLESTFALRRTSLAMLLAACGLGISLWTLAHEVYWLNHRLGLPAFEASLVEAAQRLIDEWTQLRWSTLIVALALAPAVGEELFFRGYLFGALRARWSAAWTIVATAVVFGLFHVVAGSVLAVERFLPSLFLGLVLGWLRFRAGSIYPGIVLHGLHNGLLVSIGYYHAELDQWLARVRPAWALEDATHLPASWLVAGGLVAAGSLALAAWSARRSPPDARRGARVP